MKRNIGTSDRLLRLGLGVAVIAAGLYLLTGVYWTIGALVALAGAFLVMEAAVGWCAFYALLGKNTCPVEAR